MTLQLETIYIEGVYLEEWQLPYFINKFYKDEFYYNVIYDTNGKPFISKEEVLYTTNTNIVYTSLQNTASFQMIPYEIYVSIEES